MAMALGAYSGVGENLADSFFGGMRLFAFVDFGAAGDVVDWVVIGDELGQVAIIWMNSSCRIAIMLSKLVRFRSSWPALRGKRQLLCSHLGERR